MYRLHCFEEILHGHLGLLLSPGPPVLGGPVFMPAAHFALALLKKEGGPQAASHAEPVRL